MTDFEAIYKQYFHDVYRFALSLSQDETIAEEITQQTFFKALTAINRFRGNCQLKVWLCQIAKNCYFSYYTSRQNYDQMQQATSSAETSNVETLYLQKEDTQAIHIALHNLEEPYKEVFTLRVFGGLSYSEISNLFGKTESWARVTFHRAGKKLRDIIGKDEQID